MSNIIEYIDELRTQRNVKIKDLCKYCKINKNSYTNYLNGSKPTFETVKAMLTYLGQELITIDKKYQI